MRQTEVRLKIVSYSALFLCTGTWWSL